MPLGAKGTLVFLGLGCALIAVLSLCFQEHRERCLRASLSARAEWLVDLIKEGARTADDREQLTHFLEAFKSQSDLLLIRLARVSSHEIVAEYSPQAQQQTQEPLDDTLYGVDGKPVEGRGAKEALPARARWPQVEWLKEAHEYRYTCALHFSERGSEPPELREGLLTLHISSLHLEQELGSIFQERLIWTSAACALMFAIGLGCFWHSVANPVEGLEKLLWEKRSQGTLSPSNPHSRDEFEQIHQAIEDSCHATAHLRQQLSAKNQQVSRFMDQANWLTEAALSGNRTKMEFLATISHELRTPLNGIVGFTTLLLETSQTRDQRDYTTMVQESARTLVKLIDSLLDLSKIQAGKLKLETTPFGIQTCIREAVASISSQAQEKGLEISTKIDPTLPPTMIGDQYRVRQVLLHLLGNAVKFTECGRVSIEVRRRAAEKTAADGAPGQQLWVQITDTGPGIPAEKHTTLFRKFHQLDGAMSRRHGGTGLGLVMSKSFVELMGGEIGMASKPGMGATFWFAIPLVTGDAPPSDTSPALPPAIFHSITDDHQPTNSQPTAQSSHTNGRRVLVADDNRTNRRLAQKLLEKMGFRIDLAQNGQEAVRLVKSNAYDLVLMDWQMPEMDGTQAALEIRRWEQAEAPNKAHANRKRLPIVAVTANAMQGDRDTCLLAGMDGYIAKPLSEENLRQEIQRHLSP